MVSFINYLRNWSKALGKSALCLHLYSDYYCNYMPLVNNSSCHPRQFLKFEGRLLYLNDDASPLGIINIQNWTKLNFFFFFHNFNVLI